MIAPINVSGLDRLVYEHITANPGMPGAAIHEAVNITKRPKATYLVLDMLAGRGLLRRERDGFRVRWYATRAA